MVLTTLIAAATILSPTPQDAWELKSPFAKNFEATYSIKVNVEMNGETLEATFNHYMKVKEGGEGKPWKGVIHWTDILADGEAVGDPQPWEVVWQADGSLFQAGDTQFGDDIRRMLTPFAFLYTEKPVAKGNSWKTQVKAEEKSAPVVEYSCEAQGVESLSGKDAMKLKVSMKEVGDEGVSGEGSWWVGKDGKVLKFEVSVKDWMVPMAGPQRMPAKITGTLKS